MATQMTTVELDKGAHAAARAYCADTGIKLKFVINAALVQYLERVGYWQSETKAAELRRKRSRNA